MSKKIKKIEIKLTRLDKVIGYFSPQRLLERKKSKFRNEFLLRKYEGADAGRRTKGWNTGSSSANAEVAKGLQSIRNRARDLVRNNSYASRGVQVIANNIVGKGIKTQIKIDTRAVISNKEKRINNTWQTWANTTACDFDGVSTFGGLQRLAMRAVVESGEVIIRRRRTERRFVRGVNGTRTELPPFQLQILESDFLSLNRTVGKMENGNQIIQGIEFDQAGKRVAYHLYQAHPGGNDLFPGSRFSTVRVLAEDILHLFRPDRPGQCRGMCWFASAILKLKDFDLFEDATLKRQQCAAMYTAFVKDLEGMDADDEQEEEEELGEKMEPGIIEFLPPGKDITLSNPPGADGYSLYTPTVLRAISGSFGITYEAMTGDLSEINFSSYRGGWLEMQRNFASWSSNIMIAQMLNPTFDWFLEAVELIGSSVGNARAVHTPPRREMIDPLKESQALKLMVRSGFKTQSDAVRELGQDPDSHYTEIESDNAILDEKKIVLDTDPRKVDNTGKPVEDSSDENENTNNENENTNNEDS